MSNYRAVNGIIHTGEVYASTQPFTGDLEVFDGQRRPSTQSEWYVGSAGSDSNDGLTAATALRTLAELRERLFAARLLQTTDIFILTDLDETLTLDVEIADNPGGGAFMLRIRGEQGVTVLKTGTLTAQTAISAATNVPQDVTDAAVGDWLTAGPGGTSLVHERIRLTSGAGIEAVAWVKKRTAATVARTSPFMVVSPTQTNPSLTPAIVTPAGTETYSVERLPMIRGLDLRVWRNARGNSGANTTAVVIDSIRFDSAVDKLGLAVTTSARANAYFSRCRMDNGLTAALQQSGNGNAQLISCGSSGLVQAFGTWIFTAGGYGAVLQSTAPGTLQFGRHTLIQGGALTAYFVLCFTDGYCVFDSTGDAAAMTTPGARMLMSGTTLLWGAANTGFGIRANAGTLCNYVTTKPIVTGTAGDTVIGGAATAYAAVPFTDTAKLCAVIAT